MKRQRSDDNQAALVKLYRQLGCQVEIVSQFLSCDLIVGIPGVINWVEVKDGSKPPSRRALSEPELAFQAKWAEVVPVVNVKDEDEVLAHINRMKGITTPNGV